MTVTEAMKRLAELPPDALLCVEICVSLQWEEFEIVEVSQIELEGKAAVAR